MLCINYITEFIYTERTLYNTTDQGNYKVGLCYRKIYYTMNKCVWDGCCYIKVYMGPLDKATNFCTVCQCYQCYVKVYFRPLYKDCLCVMIEPNLPVLTLYLMTSSHSSSSLPSSQLSDISNSSRPNNSSGCLNSTTLL